MREKHRILMATDVPFWRNQTGAQQRILHLVLGLTDSGLGEKTSDVVTFFIGIANSGDRDLAKFLGLDVRFYSSDQSPSGIGKRIKWHMEGTIHLVRQSFRGRKEIENVDQPMTLDDFVWPWAIDSFAQCVDEVKPDAIVFQYVTMSYLLEGLSADSRGRIKCLVDTHDILSSRQEQFAEFGYPHWIDISIEDESRQLRKFDAILAIIDHERHIFQTVATGPTVLTVGHSLAPISHRVNTGKRSSTDLEKRCLLRVGYLGSANHSNGHALVKFIKNVWRPLQKQKADVELFIAGSICDWLMFHEESRFSSDDSMSLWIELSTDQNVQLMGKIDSVGSFYESIDVAINPVEFGTGLKVKTCEAFAYGIPSVVTSNGRDSLPPEVSSALIVCDSIKQMMPAIFALSLDQQRQRELQANASEVATNVFNNEIAYGSLIDWLYNDG